MVTVNVIFCPSKANACRLKTLISCIRLACEYSRLSFAPATKRIRGGYSQASDRYKFKQGINTLSESWKLNGNSFFELLLSDLDESLPSAGYRRERSKKQRGTVRRADNLFNSFWRPSSYVQVKKKAYFWITLASELSPPEGGGRYSDKVLIEATKTVEKQNRER